MAYSQLDDPFDAAPPPPPSRLSEQVRAALLEDVRRRLTRTESAVAGSTAMERVAICEWLGGMLHRPPLERPSPAYRPMRAFVEALWWDLADRTPDPLEPLALHPGILPSHPWGDGPDLDDPAWAPGA